jgi:hypothetical protein
MSAVASQRGYCEERKLIFHDFYVEFGTNSFAFDTYFRVLQEYLHVSIEILSLANIYEFSANTSVKYLIYFCATSG